MEPPLKKIRVCHLLSDRNVGGVMATSKSLAESSLAREFEFYFASIQEFWQQPRPDIVLFHDPCSWGKLWSLLRLRWSSRLLIHEHHYSRQFEKLKVPSPLRFRWMLRCAYGLSHCVVAISEDQANWMEEFNLVAPPKRQMITQCRELKDFLAVPDRQISDAQSPLILGVYGRFSEQKGIDLLLQAMAKIPPSMATLLVGGYGEMEDCLYHLAQDLPHVQFVGKLTNVPQFLARCDGIIIPSRWEPWGNVCLESKAAAKPIVATRVDGLIEQISECGILVSPNPDALANGIKEFCTLPREQLQIWGVAGRRSVSHAWEDYVNYWRQLLWQVYKG